MRPLIYLSFLFFICAVGATSLLSFSDKEQVIYPVKAYRYYNEQEVHISVILKTGSTHQYICAFPRNTDYAQLNKVKIGALKSASLLAGPLYYCESL